MGWLPLFGQDKEKETVELLVQQVQAIRSTMDVFKELMDQLRSKNFKKVREKIQDVKDHEQECDAIRHNIATALFEGAFLPGMRSQLNTLSDQLDDVADSIENAANMSPYFEVHKPSKVMFDTFDRLTHEADKSIIALDAVLHSLLNKEPDDLFTGKFKKMKIAEEACDQIQREVFDLVYMDKKMDPVLVQLAGNFAHMLSTVADSVECACDTMTSIKMTRHP